MGYCVASHKPRSSDPYSWEEYRGIGDRFGVRPVKPCQAGDDEACWSSTWKLWSTEPKPAPAATYGKQPKPLQQMCQRSHPASFGPCRVGRYRSRHSWPETRAFCTWRAMDGRYLSGLKENSGRSGTPLCQSFKTRTSSSTQRGRISRRFPRAGHHAWDFDIARAFGM